MQQPVDVRSLSAARPVSASIVELRAPAQLPSDLPSAAEPVALRFGPPKVVTREHTNNAVRWKQGERLNHLLEQACKRFAASDAVGNHGVTRRETLTGLFEKVIEPLALFPAHRIVGVLARDHLGRTKAQRNRLRGAGQIRRQLRRSTQFNDRRADRAGSTQATDVNRLLHGVRFFLSAQRRNAKPLRLTKSDKGFTVRFQS